MTQQHLPEGWIEIELKHLGQYINGRAFKPTEWKQNGLPIIRIQNLNNELAEYNYSDQVHEEKYLVKNGDLLMAWSASLGVYFWKGQDAWLNQHIFKVVINSKIITKEFMYYALRESIDEFYKKTHGTGMVHITKGVFENHKIPLPPLEEQARIVAKLDALFASYATFQTSLSRIPALLKRFRQTVLTQAVTGQLTDVASFTTLGEMDIDIQTGPFGSSLHQEDYVLNGIPVINPSQIKKGEIIPDLSVSINEIKAKELSAFLLNDNDVILGRRGEMGRAALYTKDLGPMLCGTGSLILRSSSKLSSQFLVYFLRSPFCVNFLTANSVGSTMINLNQKIIKSLPFPNISLAEQAEIVRRVEELLAQADALEARYVALRHTVERLPGAWLARAFRGELVPPGAVPSPPPATPTGQQLALF